MPSRRLQSAARRAPGVTTVTAGEPRVWWGPVWADPTPRTVVDLVAAETLTPEVAGLVWALVARRASVAVVAGPSGAGKTTLLTALLDLLPPGTRRVYVRGGYEPFDFLGDPSVVPSESALLVNELSPHLPIYLWGPPVRRVLRLRRSGFALYATAHADDAAGLVRLIAGPPLRVPAVEVAAFDLVVGLAATIGPRGDVRREVAGVWALGQTAAGGVTVDALTGGPGGGPLAGGMAVASAMAERLCPDIRTTPALLEKEVAARAAMLVALAARGPMPLAEARAALAERHRVTPPHTGDPSTGGISEG